MEKHSGQEIFQLALANLSLTENQRKLCFAEAVGNRLTFEDAEKIARAANVKSFTLEDWNMACSIIDLHYQHKIKVIPIGTDLYPKSFALIKNPPKILFAKGNLDLLKVKNSVSIVGSRSATDYGLKVAEKIATHFTKESYVIVSGLASGIDSKAHYSCLTNNGNTIAVLAHGLHRIYPSENTFLGNLILNKRGLLISEHSFGVEPKKHFFVLRNRIQVGLSSFSIIIEAKKKSGTMSHADYCLEARHPLYVVLPHIHDAILASSFEGNQWLFEEKGALPLRSSADYPAVLV